MRTRAWLAVMLGIAAWAGACSLESIEFAPGGTGGGPSSSGVGLSSTAAIGSSTSASSSASASSSSSSASSGGGGAGGASATTSGGMTSSSTGLTCDSMHKPCNGACVDVADPQYGCGPTSCDPCMDLTHVQCVNGQCGCSSGFADCAGAGCSTNTTNDPMHCGGCGTTCQYAPPNGSPACVNSACTFTCNGGLTACGGNCVDLSTDPNNCGQCNGTCGDLDCNGPGKTCTCSSDDECGSGTCGLGVCQCNKLPVPCVPGEVCADDYDCVCPANNQKCGIQGKSCCPGGCC